MPQCDTICNEQLKIDKTVSCITQLRTLRDVQRKFNLSNEPRRTFKSFITPEYEALKSQLEPMNPWNWADLTQQIESYPQFRGQRLTVLVWNLYAQSYRRNGPIGMDETEVYTPSSVADVIQTVNREFLSDLSSDLSIIDGTVENFLLSRIDPIIYLPSANQSTVNMLEEKYLFCFFKFPKDNDFRVFTSDPATLSDELSDDDDDDDNWFYFP